MCMYSYWEQDVILCVQRVENILIPDIINIAHCCISAFILLNLYFGGVKHFLSQGWRRKKVSPNKNTENRVKKTHM